MAAVRIIVGASSDGSMATVFRPLVEAAARAKKAIVDEFKELKGNIGELFKLLPQDAVQSFAKITEAEKKELERQIAAVRDAETEKKKIRDENRRSRGGGGGGGGGEGRGRDDGYRTAYASARYFDRTLRGAGRGAMDMATKAGVNLDVGELIAKSVNMRKLATDLANSAWQPNAPDDGKGNKVRTRVSEETLIREARNAANTAAMDPTKAMTGMQNFVGVSGDLATAREIVPQLGVLARATGTEFDDMVTAAGEVAAKLGDVENKGSTVMSVMKVLAGQGKLGAVEIKNMAVEMAKVGSVSKSFNMSPDKAMQEMGILMQMARQSGGAKSASVAANSAMALVQTLTKGSTIKNLKAAGVQPFADKGETQLLPPETMILAMLHQSKGSLKKLGGMVKDTMAFRSVRGFANVYNETKGSDEDKLNAVRKSFKGLRAANMGDGEVQSQFDASMANPEAKIQLFNNRLAEIGEQIAGKVLPQLEKLAPVIIQAVEAFGKFVAWAAENPGQALAAALTASVARAGLDTILRAGIESIFKGGGGPGGKGGGGGFWGGLGGEGTGKLGKGIAAAGMALMITSAAITVENAGELVIESMRKRHTKSQAGTENLLVEGMNVRAGANKDLREGNADIETVTKLKAEKEKLDQRIRDAEENKAKGGLRIGSGIGAWLGMGGDSFAKQSQMFQDAQRLNELKAESARQTAILAQAFGAGAVLRVHVVNGPTPQGGGTSPGRK